MHIGLDLDDTTYKFVGKLRQWINICTGRPIEAMPDAESWTFFSEQWGYTRAEYLELIRKGILAREMFWDGDHVEHAPEVIHWLRKAGHKITFITARAYEPIVAEVRLGTERWLEAHEIEYDDLIITNGPKYGYGFDVLFDDSPQNILDVRDAGEHAVVYDQTWNHHIEGPRVHGWYDLLTYVRAGLPEKNKKQVGFSETS